ncbi:MAG: tetratricopeptide repeat protein [Chloroflexota bacterium]|nr:MAG: tetratricopeptide repeat protein [Chloroflexota bacterium]
MDIEETIERAKELRRDDKLEESQDLLLELLEEFPDDPVVLLEAGGSYDVMGLEPEAIPYYRQAIEQGLVGDALYECMICLGSSQRLVGDFDDAVEILEKANDQFPEGDGAQAFLALAYYSNDQYEEAVSLLLDLLVRTSNSAQLREYAGALDYYKDNLDELWEE